MGKPKLLPRIYPDRRSGMILPQELGVSGILFPRLHVAVLVDIGPILPPKPVRDHRLQDRQTRNER